MILKIIKWIINFIKKLFGLNKKKNIRKVRKEINILKKEKVINKYNSFIDVSDNIALPTYFIVSKDEVNTLINKAKEIKEELKKIDNTSQEIKLVDDIISKLEHIEIPFYVNNKIDENLDYVLYDKKIDIDTNEKIINLNKDFFEIIENYDKDIKKRTIKEYKKVNYITLTNVLLDDTFREISQMEDNIKNHRYNKFYYERELEKLKRRINNLKKLHEHIDVQKEILNLKKDIYTKSKDKYDLLYNEEVFINGIKTCDNMLKKINRRIIDIKKQEKEEVKIKKEEKKEEKKKEKEENTYLLNILKRFQDMELARRLIMLKEEDHYDQKDVFSYLNSIYTDFLNGEKMFFNFNRNKTKTEIVKLYNSLNKISALFSKEESMYLEHINYQMEDLISITVNEKTKLENTLENKFHYQKEKDEKSILVDNKLNLLLEKELDIDSKQEHILVKK